LFEWHNLISLTQNMAVVVLFLVIGNRLSPSVIHLSERLGNLIRGLLFGVAGILSMLIPYHPGIGVLAPLYPIFGALSAWLGGPVSALATLVCMIGIRLLLGGAGITAGMVSILAAASIGLLYRAYRKPDLEHRFRFVHPLLIGILVTLTSVSSAILLPASVRTEWFWRCASGAVVVFPASSILIHYFMNMEWTRKRRYAIDEETGLMSSAPFIRHLHKLIRSRVPFSLALLDLDGSQTIKAINCKMSRAQLLKQAGQRLKNGLPDNASVCRFEGEEFLIVLPAPAAKKIPPESHQLWNELQTLLTSPYLVNDQLYHLTVHIGVTAYWDEELTVEQLIPRAYAALHLAKESRVQQTVHYHEKLTEQIRRRTMIEVYVRTALADNQFNLHYQPQYEVDSGKLRGFEALIRWRHPELGAIEPKELLPIAESTKTLIPIGEWIIRRSCLTLLQVAPSPSELTIAVNVAAQQLLDPGFPEAVERILSDTGLAPHRLELEVKELSIVGFMDQAEHAMRKLRSLGVRLALDDYGLTSASAACLRLLPVHIVKIDNNLLLELTESSGGDASVSLLEEVKRQRCEIVAMRLETYGQLAFFKKNECEFAQGHLLGMPMDGDSLLSLVDAP